jgi:hypothetical protein
MLGKFVIALAAIGLISVAFRTEVKMSIDSDMQFEKFISEFR